VIALLASLLLQEPAPVFTKFEFARERVGHKVVADALLVNLQEADLADARVVVVYFDRDLELKRSRPVGVPRLPPGRPVPVKVEVEQLPNFTRYRVYVEVGGRTFEYLGDDPLRTPVARQAAPAKLSLVESKREEAGLTVVVRNTGELEAREPVAVLRLPDRVARVRLAPGLPGATEATYSIRVAGVPHADAVAWTVLDGPSQKEEKDVPQLALRAFRTAKLSDGSVRLEGSVRNGFDRAVEKVVVTFRLAGKTVPIVLPGGLKPGEVRDFEVHLDGAGALDGAGFDLAYADAASAAAPPEAPKPPSVLLLGSRSIEIARAKLPEAQEEKPKADAKAPSMKVGVRGLMKVGGEYLPKSGKYTGDVYLLRVAFLDGAGNPATPNATLNATLHDGQKETWKVQRLATKATWKIDAARLNNQNTDHTTIACDLKTGELWIGLIRSESGFPWKIDLSVTVKEFGAWTFKGIEGDKWESPEKVPDKPAK
jgi:hypothetical protein